MRRRTRVARTGDGIRIAYATHGTGPPLVEVAQECTVLGANAEDNGGVAPLDRRRFLLLGAGSLLAACGASPRDSAVPAAPLTRRPDASVAGPTPSPAGLPPRVRWQPDPNDLVPAAEIAAVRTVEERGNRAGHRLLVLDVQYGGLLAASASVLVVCRTWARTAGGGVRAGGATYDVRVRRSGPRWHVTAVHPSHPGPPARSLSRQAREVLASRRIDLPPAARADVRSGLVHASVLSAMLTLAGRYRVGVSVLRSGHPTYVFGTRRLSDHPLGRAFDTCCIDGQPVVDARTPRRLVVGYMEAAAAAGSYNVGGPYPLGSAPQFFSDDTHHDHVHAGFTT